jgi:hypothetical protein
VDYYGYPISLSLNTGIKNRCWLLQVPVRGSFHWIDWKKLLENW